jgi:hypothetical protein
MAGKLLHVKSPSAVAVRGVGGEACCKRNSLSRQFQGRFRSARQQPIIIHHLRAPSFLPLRVPHSPHFNILIYITQHIQIIPTVGATRVAPAYFVCDLLILLNVYFGLRAYPIPVFTKDLFASASDSSIFLFMARCWLSLIIYGVVK